jgi:hypothetical protein
VSLPYLPPRDQDLRAWAANFDALVNATPGLFGLSPADGVAIHTYVSAYSAALSASTDPATRTGVTITAKDAARAAMLDVVRGYARQVRNNQGVSDAAKLTLGLRLPDLTPTPVPAPATAPVVIPVAAQPLEQTLRYADVATPDRRAKPSGAAGLELYVAIAAAGVVPSGPNDGRFRGLVTRQPFAVAFDPADRGKTAWYWGRWTTRTGKTGPWSATAALVIA